MELAKSIKLCWTHKNYYYCVCISGIAVMCVGLQGIMYVSCIGDQKLFPSEESIDEFASYFAEELHSLAKNIP